MFRRIPFIAVGVGGVGGGGDLPEKAITQDLDDPVFQALGGLYSLTEQLEKERNYLREGLTEEKAARLEAEKRAAIAETKADMLSNQVDQLTAEKSEKRPPAWQFWRR